MLFHLSDETCQDLAFDKNSQVTASEVWQINAQSVSGQTLLTNVGTKGNRASNNERQALIVLSWPNWLIRSTLESKNLLSAGAVLP